MQNLSSEENVRWHRLCDRHRELAKNAPCFHIQQASMEAYRFSLGPFHCCFTLDRFIKPPSWHGSVSILKQIGDEAVRDEAGHYIFDAPQEALVAVRSWDKEEQDIARDILGKMFGPLIQRDTRVIVSDGVFARHWLVEALDA